MKIITKQFGEVNYTKNLQIHFPKGIIGFEQCKHFIIIDDEDCKPFKWLISIDEEELGFPILDPFIASKEFGKELPNRLVKRLFEANSSVEIYSIVTLNGSGGKITINLKSPVVIDYTQNSGEQIILASDNIPVAQPIT